MSTEEEKVLDDIAAEASKVDNENDDDLDPSAARDSSGAGGTVDAEIEEMKRRVQEMEEEAAKISEMQSQVEKQMGGALPTASGTNVDDCSVFVGQVDYESTAEELQALFQSCGTINRVTILCDKFSGQPKGFAYIEFADKTSAENALLLDDTVFRGRNLKVMPKRQNVPRFQLARGRGRGGRVPPSFRGRGRGRGGYRGGFRGRGRFHPYYG